MDIESKNFWAEEMLSCLGQLSSAELLQKAQDAAQAAGHGFFTSRSNEAPLVDLEGEVAELLEAIRSNHSTAHIRNEVGDIIFCLINICRLNGVNFADAVDKVAERWLARKTMQEKRIRQVGCTWRTIPPEVNKKIWQEIKVELKEREYQK